MIELKQMVPSEMTSVSICLFEATQRASCSQAGRLFWRLSDSISAEKYDEIVVPGVKSHSKQQKFIEGFVEGSLAISAISTF